MTRLTDVTLCAADCLTPRLAAQALARSASALDFGDIVLFSHEMVQCVGRTVQIDKLDSRVAYSAFLLKGLVKHIRTPYVLIVQWDGFVVDPARWSDDFLGVDYVGAWWGWFQDGRNVGNGGFSLRSMKLLERTADRCADLDTEVNEDMVICRILRPELESEDGIVFASQSLANRFSYEREPPSNPTFGFHGVFNFWRHVDDSAVLRLLPELPGSVVTSQEFIDLVITYLQQRKFSMFLEMFRAIRRWETLQSTLQKFGSVLTEPGTAERVVAFGERLTR